MGIWILPHFIILVDQSRYVVRSDVDRGVVTLFWKEKERDDNEEEFISICDVINKKPGNRRMTMSCSATMAIYDASKVVSRLFLWYSWHEHWLYGTQPTVRLPASMPLRAPVFELPSKTSQGSDDEPSAASDMFEDLISAHEIEDAASVTESLTKSLSGGSSTSAIDTADTDSLTGDFDEGDTIS